MKRDPQLMEAKGRMTDPGYDNPQVLILLTPRGYLSLLWHFNIANIFLELFFHGLLQTRASAVSL